MATLFSESFEEGTNGTAITTADSNFTNFVAPGTWVFSNAHVVPLYGSMAGKCTASGSTAIANAGSSVWASKAITYYDWSFHVDSLPTSNATIHSFRNGSTAIADLRLLTTGAVQIRDGGFVQRAVSPAIATAGKDVRVQAKVDSTNGKLQLRVAVGSANITSGTWDYDSGLVAASSLQPTTNFQIGFVSSTTGVLEWGGFTVDDASFPGPAANTPPTCSASASPSPAAAGATVTLSGTDSDSDGTIASRQWTQTSGTAVTLTGATTATATFTAPSVAGGTTLGFSYTVTDNSGATATSTVSVTVLSSSGSVAIRDSAQNTNATTAANTTVTVPATTVVGDKMLAIFLDGTGSSLTETLTASGWQAVGASTVGSSIGLHVWQKTAVSGDAGSTLTVTSSVDGISTYKRTFVVVVAQGARMGNVGAAPFPTTATTSHTAPGEAAVATGAMAVNIFADSGSPGSTSFSLPSNLTALQTYPHTGTHAVTSVVAYDDNVTGTAGGNTATGTISTVNAVAATIILEPGTPTNPPPTVNAGADQSNVEPWTSVTVGGTDTPQGTATIASWQWEQISGADVTGSFSGDTTANLTFTTPGTLYGTTIGLRKTVTDSTGVSNSDDVQVDVLPATRRVVLGGVETPARRFYVSP